MEPSSRSLTSPSIRSVTVRDTASGTNNGEFTSRIPVYRPASARYIEQEPVVSPAEPPQPPPADASVSRKPSASNLRTPSTGIRKDRIVLRDDIMVKLRTLEDIQFDESAALVDGYYSTVGEITEGGTDDPLDSKTLAANVVAPPSSFVDLGVASARKAGGIGDNGSVYALAHWRFAQPSDVRRRADLLNSSEIARDVLEGLPELSFSRMMNITSAIWEFHLHRAGQKQGPAGSPSVLAGVSTFRTKTSPLAGTGRVQASPDNFVDFIGGVYEYFSTNFDGVSPQSSPNGSAVGKGSSMFHAYLRQMTMFSTAGTGYQWLMKHMLGLAGPPGSYNPLFAEAALAVMRAVRRMVPERKATYAQALFAKGPIAGANIGSVRVQYTPATSATITSPTFSFAGSNVISSGYEPAMVPVATAIRIVEQILTYSPAFAMAPLQRFADTLGLRRNGWSAAGKRDITEMLLACTLGSFDVALLLASDLQPELLIGKTHPGGGVDVLDEDAESVTHEVLDSSITFPSFFGARGTNSGSASRRMSFRSDAAGDMLDSPPLPFSDILTRFSDTLAEALSHSSGTPLVSVEELVIGLMAAWLREYERWCRRMDRAYNQRLILDRHQHDRVVHSIFERHLNPVFKDLEDMLTVLEPGSVTEEDAAYAAKSATANLLDTAISESRTVCLHEPTMTVLLATELRKLLTEAVGTMAKVNAKAVNLLTQAQQEHARAKEKEAAMAESILNAEIVAKAKDEIAAARQERDDAVKRADELRNDAVKQAEELRNDAVKRADELRVKQEAKTKDAVKRADQLQAQLLALQKEYSRVLEEANAAQREVLRLQQEQTTKPVAPQNVVLVPSVGAATGLQIAAGTQIQVPEYQAYIKEAGKQECCAIM